MEVLKDFQNYRCSEIFRKCGYQENGKFNPGIGMSQDIDQFDMNCIE